MSQTPLAPVIASSVRMIPWTIHGWRPTSVTIQPASMAMIASTPETATMRRNHTVWGKSRFRHQEIPNQSPRKIIPVPIPTIASKARCRSVFAGGRSSSGTESSPITSVSVLQPTRNESSPGIPIPNLTPSSVQIPPMYSVTCVSVSSTHSIAANLIGWCSAISRAAVSPTKNWIGARIEATVSGISSPRRWWRSRRPRSIPTAYTEATRKAVTR